MIDIHSHILNNLDDGSSSIEESIAMAKEAELSGITAIICTPHHNKGEICGANRQQIIDCKNRLQEELNKSNCNITLYSGNEVYINDTFEEELKNCQICSLADSNYVLIEFPMNIEYNYLDNIIFSIKNLNKIPILAHPERYVYIQNNKDKIYDYLSLGVLLQCNIGSILGLYGSSAKHIIKFLLKNHLISILATDAHHADSVYIKLDMAKHKILKIIGNNEYELLTTINSKKIINNEDI